MRRLAMAAAAGGDQEQDAEETGPGRKDHFPEAGMDRFGDSGKKLQDQSGTEVGEIEVTQGRASLPEASGQKQQDCGDGGRGQRADRDRPGLPEGEQAEED